LKRDTIKIYEEEYIKGLEIVCNTNLYGIRLCDFPQEYWRLKTSFEIGCAIGKDISLYEPTRNRVFSHFARLLVDVDFIETYS
jgi:hypothetical protein